MFNKLLVIAASLALAASLACTSRVDSDDDPGGDPDVVGEDTTVTPDKDVTPGTDAPGKTDTPTPAGSGIKALQQKDEGLNCPEGSDFINLDQGVPLSGVIVTAPVHSVSDKLEGFYAQDSGGGAYSGIKVVMDKGTAPQVAVGDVVDITGDLKEYYCLTEFDAINVTASGTQQDPTSVTVAEDAIAAKSAATEQYEGVLVTVENATVGSVNNFGGFETQAGVIVDDAIFGDLEPAGDGCVYTSITGVIDFGYGDYVLLPRTAADLVLSGGDCGPVEPDTTTIEAIQTANESVTCPTPGGENITNVEDVALADVVVASPRFVVSSDKLHGFFGYEGDGEANQGVLFLTDFDKDVNLSVGDIIYAEGSWTEFYCLTEIKVTEYSVTDQAEDQPPVNDISVSDLLGNDAEKWEGSLVRLTGTFKVTEIDEHGDILLDDAGDEFKMLADFGFGLNPPVDTTYTEIVGFVTYDYGEYKILPASADNLKE